MTNGNIPDFSNLTCTNFMIKLKINLKKLSNKEIFEFFTNREQNDNIKNHFSKPPYVFDSKKIDNNIYYNAIKKN